MVFKVLDSDFGKLFLDLWFLTKLFWEVVRPTYSSFVKRVH